MELFSPLGQVSNVCILSFSRSKVDYDDNINRDIRLLLDPSGESDSKDFSELLLVSFHIFLLQLSSLIILLLFLGKNCLSMHTIPSWWAYMSCVGEKTHHQDELIRETHIITPWERV